MCTSVACGFYIRDKDAFDEFKLKMLALSKLDNCIFSIYEETPNYMKYKYNGSDDDCDVAEEYNHNSKNKDNSTNVTPAKQSVSPNNKINVNSKDDEDFDDDFVVI